MLRVWNLSLLCATFSLTILGTFLTRSGRARVGARLQRQRHRRVAPVVLRAHRRGHARPDRLARRPAALARAASTRPCRARAPSSPTTCCSPASRSWCCSARCSRCSRRRSTTVPVTVGPPYFNRMTVPIGHRAAVPHGGGAGAARGARRPSEVLAQRLLWPAWAGAITMALAVALGARGPGHRPGLRARRRSPAGPRVRQVVLATRRQGWRGFVGRTNGGMIVHIGVVIVAVAIATNGHYVTRSRRATSRARRAWSAATRSPTCAPTSSRSGTATATKVQRPGRRRPGVRARPVAVPGLRLSSSARRR